MNLVSKKSAWIVGAAMVGAISLSGCATEKFVRTETGKVDARVTAANGRIDAQGQTLAQHDARLKDHDARLAGLDQATRDAMARADAAHKLAEGKFLYLVVLSDDAVKFKTGHAALSPEGEAALSAFAAKLKADNHNVYVEIQGHTDATGKKARNQALGLERAEAVRLFLNKQGVPLSRMSTISYGAEAPVQPNNTRAGRAANRRVVLIVLS